MADYSNILKSFADIGYSQSSILDEQEVNEALDKIYQKSTSSEQLFNREVAQEIYQQTPKNAEQEVRLKDYIKTILEAHTLLKKYIHQHNQQISKEKDKEKKIRLTTLLHQYTQDLQLLTKLFVGIKPSSKSEEVPPKSPISNSSDMGDIFSDVPKEGKQSNSLKITLAIAVGCFAMEFLLMFQKHHFLSMLAYVAVLAIFLMNYFDKAYIRATLSLLAASIFLDFLWVLLQADHYWNISGASQHPSQQKGFFRFIYIMSLISMLAKAAITYLLFRYRANTIDACKTVRLFNFRFDLNAAAGSPLTNLLAKMD